MSNFDEIEEYETPLADEDICGEEAYDEEIDSQQAIEEPLDNEISEVEQEESLEELEEQLEEDEDENSLTDEELDQVADTAIETLRGILAFFGAEDVGIDEYEGDEGEILLDVVGDDLAILIGRHGRTLDSIQFLVTAILYKRLGFRYPVVIDIEGYKYRRRQKIENIAHKAAGRAIKQGKAVSLRPMTPYERRIVHIALREESRVSTSSEGNDPNRYVVITPLKY